MSMQTGLPTTEARRPAPLASRHPKIRPPGGATRRAPSQRLLRRQLDLVERPAGEGISEDVVDGLPADAERLGNRGRPHPLRPQFLRPLLDLGLPRAPLLVSAFAIPSSWRSLRRAVSNSAKTLSMSKNALPAGVLVSIGCSVAFRLAPLARSVLTMSCAGALEIGTQSAGGPRRPARAVTTPPAQTGADVLVGEQKAQRNQSLGDLDSNQASQLEERAEDS
jgi:hypothetical protein